MEIASKKNYRINYGVELLRMILCFWVINFHSGGIMNKKKKILKTFFHVPTFMIISFYFSYKTFISKNIIKIKEKLYRLIIPFIIIPIIDLGIKNNLSYFKSPENYKIIFYNLFLQYITGYKTYIILWFVQILLIFTIIFEIIFYYFNKNSIFIFHLLLIISYWLQYSEINYQIFNKYKPHLRSISHFA